MSQVNDLMFSFFRGLGYTGALPDMRYQWLVDNGYSSMRAAMAAEGFSSGSIADFIASFFTSSQYAVNGFEPGLVFDPTANYFKTTQGNYTDLEDAATFSRSGLATMVDSDGVLKWAPHNLIVGNSLLYSTTLANGVDGAEFSASSDRDFRTVALGTQPAGVYTIAFWVDSFSGTLSRPVAYIEAANPASAINKAELSVGLVTKTFTWSGGNMTNLRIGVGTDANDTGDLLLGGVHLYRSDLGGMVNNPARGDSYVPTTSAARYLPRVNHHIYNGSAWVNEGLLIESEARTNLLTYSEDFTQWTEDVKGALTPNQTDGPRGSNSAALWSADELDSFLPLSLIVVGLETSSAVSTYSVAMKANTVDWVQIRIAGLGSQATEAYFNISTGAVGTTGADVVTAQTVDLGNGWYLCSVSFTGDASDSGGSVQIAPAVADGDTSVGAGDSIYIDYAQLEAGFTPSSYIPTSGATATRAAETLSIAAADLPWPEPNVIGPELVTNGTFDDGTGWTADNEWSIAGGVAEIGSAGSFSSLSTSIASTTGKHYLVTFDLGGTVANGVEVRMGNGTGGGSAKKTATASGTNEVVLESVPAGGVLAFVSNTAFDGTIDNISVREIDPLAVSIAINGRVTYADRGLSAEAQFVSWFEGLTEYIVLDLETTASRTGAITITQREPASGLDDVESSSTTYSPGLNVPFNIASRHGSTFINGAVDGTALTANTTPTALPGLSATDLDLCPTFMGTMNNFILWADDLTDAGNEEETS